MTSKTSKSKKDKNSDLITKKEDAISDKTYLTKEVETSISLLESRENAVVFESLLFLSKYGDLKEENLVKLQKNGLACKILSLLKRNVCILRMSLRLLGILLRIDATVFELDQDIYDEQILEISSMYTSHPDEFVKQFCFPILSRLATSNRITTLIFKADLFTPIFETLEKSDKVELIKNTLDLLYILLDAPAAIGILADIKVFKVELIMKYIDHYDTDIQNKSLEIIRKLTYFQIEAIQKMFREQHLVEKMLNIIMDEELKLHHNKAFSILSNCMDCDETNAYFVDTLEFIKFCQWVKKCGSEYMLLCVSIFYQLTLLPDLRQILFDLSVEESILMFLRSKDKKVLNYTCKAISNMTEHTYCCQRMLTPIVFKEILGILRREYDPEDPENEVALKTLHDFVVRNYVIATQMLAEYDGLPVILKYLQKGTPTLSEDSFSRVLHILNMVSVHPEHKKAIINDEIFKLILSHLSNTYADVRAAAVEIVTNFVPLEPFREFFLNSSGPAYILEVLQNATCLDYIKALLVFIHSILIYKNVAEAFLHNKILAVLKGLPKHIAVKTPLADQILKLIYTLYLPVKFFELGRLDVMDKLKNRFYVVTGNWTYDIPFLEIYEAQAKCPRNTVYVVNYSAAKHFDMVDSNESLFDESDKQEGSITTVELVKTVSDYTIDYGHISNDPFLPRYINHIQQYFTEDTCLSHKVRLLAEYVDTLLCGPKEDYIPSQKLHTFKFHIQALKEKLGNNIIPIGFLRLGFHCEKALLFKAIADKVSIPTTLVRGRGNIYWNEVALMREYNVECIQSGFCGNLEMFVVDLMSEIGKLLPIGSRDANAYCRIFC
ncbi:unnamed protein product [Brassicogethes aeneus]|uniref:EDR1/CTR1/ARMC3-like peptidase-like domain-containing protein n=1 Tax=Brassicogethes aeneus TaxID=1431903 RepID=A0A9P0FH42_BRAAE|nr:unnamed protein product [Brassicogethes aeneus]